MKKLFERLKTIFRGRDEEAKRSVAIARGFNLPNYHIVIRRYGGYPDYMTTYMIRNEIESYYVLSKSDRINCAAWHLWMLWNSTNKKDSLLSFYDIDKEDELYFTEKGDNVPEKYWQLYRSLQPIKTDLYVHISETHPILRQMATIIGKQFGFATILNQYDHKTEYFYWNIFLLNRGYYIYRIK